MPTSETTRQINKARKAVEDIEASTVYRNQAVVAARDAGATWRSIAAATGLTEMGLRRIYERTNTAKETA